ncbi:MAG: hypothetical protein NT062_21360 [Proteobacteria bacterium]|nr:hypothetical protein [Pseudomonadota bacterium]
MRHLASRCAIVLVGSIGSIGSIETVAAQPAPPTDKTDAKALLQSGLKLFTAKDYLGALAVFRDAYARFPSAKILLNIATTLTRLERKADAANAYQRYLDAPDHDPAKQAEVTKVLAELDRAVGTLELTVSPDDAEVQIDDDAWLASKAARRYRVARTDVVVRARLAGYKSSEQPAHVGVGEQRAVAVALVVIPAPLEPVHVPVVSDPAAPRVDARVPEEASRARFGALAQALVDVPNRGGAARVGLTVDVSDRVQAQAMALLGGTSGGYLGASVALLTGAIRPIVSAGLPIFISNGARVAIRGAGGVELLINRHLSVIVELGVEHVFNPEMDVVANTFIPAVGVAGRL